MISISDVGTPFVLRKLQIKQNTFNKDYYQCDVIPFSENGPPANSISFNKKNAIKAAIGEHLERTSVYVNNKRFKQEMITGINMITSEEVTIPLYRILLNWSSPILENIVQSEKYNDTCGLACHTSSYNCIQSAFFEFFERQCLLYNWFTGSSGKKINMAALMKDEKIKNLLEMAYFHVEEVHFFDISLSDDIKVVISLAFGAETKGVGLCAGWNYKQAIMGSIKELFQYITVQHQRKEISDNEDLTDPLYYSTHFLNQVNSETLRRDFHYLIAKSEPIDIEIGEDDLTITEQAFNSIIRGIVKELDLDLILCYIPELYTGINTKIAKILTTKGFHHMYAAKIVPTEVPFLQHHKQEFCNIGKMIPFG